MDPKKPAFKFTPLKAIKKKCVECAGNKWNIRNCRDAECPLFAFRMGHNPNRRGIGRLGDNPELNRNLKIALLK